MTHSNFAMAAALGFLILSIAHLGTDKGATYLVGGLVIIALYKEES